MNEINDKINKLDSNAKILIYLLPFVILAYFIYEAYENYSYDKENIEIQINKNKASNYNYRIKKLKIKNRKKNQIIPTLTNEVENKKLEVYAIKDRLQGGVKTLLSPKVVAGILQNILSWSIVEKVDLTELKRSYASKGKKNRVKTNDKVDLQQIVIVEGISSYNSFIKFLSNIEEMKMMSKISNVEFELDSAKIKFKYRLEIFGITLDEDI